MYAYVMIMVYLLCFGISEAVRLKKGMSWALNMFHFSL